MEQSRGCGIPSTGAVWWAGRAERTRVVGGAVGGLVPSWKGACMSHRKAAGLQVGAFQLGKQKLQASSDPASEMAPQLLCCTLWVRGSHRATSAHVTLMPEVCPWSLPPVSRWPCSHPTASLALEWRWSPPVGRRDSPLPGPSLSLQPGSSPPPSPAGRPP